MASQRSPSLPHCSVLHLHPAAGGFLGSEHQSQCCKKLLVVWKTNADAARGELLGNPGVEDWLLILQGRRRKRKAPARNMVIES